MPELRTQATTPKPRKPLPAPGESAYKRAVPDDQSQERRVRMADAALKLLAREGARGLSHRAIDAELGLASGSTSYYFRTRAALQLAAAERLLELDAADAERVTPDAEGLAGLLGRWLTPEGRTRSLARMELLLAAARDPSLDFMRGARKRFLRAAEAALRTGNGANDSPQALAKSAISLIALMDGLTLHGLVSGELSPSVARSILEAHSSLPASKPGPRRQLSKSKPK
jgi:DNA-binding transcriptional regulator YbjK